jgi:Flp pilus assembly protein CpaB
MVGRIPVGFRAVSVKIDEVTGVAYQLKPGSWVDVIVVMDVITGTGRGSKETIAKVILQHVKVAAIGRLTSGPADGRGSKMKPAKSVTLLVLERDVPKLHLAATRGKVTLAMRGDDENTTDLPGIARESEVFNVFGDKKTPESNAQVAVATTRPKRAPFTQPVRNEPHRVVVYHGTPGGPSTVEQIIFENVRSRNVVELGRGPVNRDGRSLLDDDRDGRESRDAGARRNRRHLGGIPDFSNLEAE